MSNRFYIQISVTDEQKQYARQLVEYSLKNHPVANIWDHHSDRLSQTRMLRYTGTLGEVIFADLYHLPRPLKSFGAIDGQDWGQDFQIKSENESFSVDIKSMKRRSGNLAADFVLNIPAHQLRKAGSKTTHYFCISFHQSETRGTIASLIGFLDKLALEKGEAGQLYKAGTKRIRHDQTSFIFYEDTYEILLKDIDSPVVTDHVRRAEGYRLCHLLT